MSNRCSKLVAIRDKVTDAMINAYSRNRPEASLLLAQAMELTELTANLKCKHK